MKSIMEDDLIESQLMYMGMRESHGHINHEFVHVKEGNILGKIWTFDSKLFSKGSVGAVYACKLSEAGHISYKKKAYPIYVLQKDGMGYGTSLLFPKEIDEAETLHHQAGIAKQNATKVKSRLDTNIAEIRETYRLLTNTKKARFIADLVYKITR